NVEPNLVVALARAAVCDRARILPPRHLYKHRRNERPAERGCEWVFLLVHGTGLQRWPDEELEEGLAAIGHISGRGARLERPGLDGFQILLLAEVDGEGNHIPARVLEPADRHRRVKSARIGEHDLPGHASSPCSKRCFKERPAPGCRSTAMIVSSPATVPAIPGSDASSMRLA